MNLNVQLLGPVEVACGSEAIGLGGPKPRALLAMLALEAGSAVSTDRLTDGLWGEEPPATSSKLIQVYVSHLRKAFAGADVDGAIVTRGHGYELAVDRAQVDATRFERLLAQGAAREALQLWRGSPLSDVSLEPFAPAEIRRLTELRSAALEVAIDQDLEAGRHREVLPELESLLGQEPLRERLHAQRILALYRCGRQADALEAYRQARETLINDVGVEPGPELRRLHDAILRQDTSIDAPVTDRLADLAERTSKERARWRIAEDEFAAGVVELQDRQQRSGGNGASPDVSGPPFKGLETFDVGDAEIFFGRERQVADMVARLPGSRLVGVIGASGSGKSSLLRAGLLPALAAGVLPGSGDWAMKVIRPGDHPYRVLQDAIGALPADAPAVLLVDQFEETFTACTDDDERNRFIDEVVALARDHRRRTLVIIAMRSDFYGHCAAYSHLSHMIEANTLLVGPMRVDELRRAIELPARAANYSVEPELVEALTADVEGQPGALPLLSTALLELWQAATQWQPKDERSLRLVTYQQSGGVHGAVARLAESVYTDLDEEQQQRARRLLLRLAGEGDLRLRVPLSELAAYDDVVAVLAAARLVTVDEGHVEVAHEALLREWPRLVQWLEEDAEGRRVQRHLTATARDWAASGRDPGDLYRGSRLVAAAEWATGHPEDLTDVERAFIDASVASDQAEAESHRRTNRRLRTLLSGVAGLLVLAVAAGAIAFWQRSRAEDVAVIADARRLGAEALTREQLDEALLLASAGADLHPSPETHGSLLSILLRQPAMLGDLRGDGSPLTSVAVSDDGTMIATAAERGTITVYDVGTRMPRREPYRASGYPLHLVFSPDGGTVAVAVNGAGSLIELIDVRTGTRRDRFEVPEYQPAPGGPPLSDFPLMTAAYHPNGRDLIVQQSDSAFFTKQREEGFPPGGPPMLTLLNGETGEVLQSQHVGRSNAAFFAATADRQRLFVTSPADGATYEIDANTLAVRRTHPVGDFWAGISPGGDLLALGSKEGRVRLVDLESGQTRSMSGRHEDGSDMILTIARDGRTIVSSAGSGELIVWDIPSRRIRERRAAHEQPIWGLLASQDGRSIYTAGNDGGVKMWDLAGDRRLDQRFYAGPRLEVEHDVSPKGFALSPEGRSMAVAQGDGSVDVLDPVTFERQARLTADETVLAMAYSPDGKLLAGTGLGGEILIWDVRREETIQRLEGQPFTVSESLAFSHDGKHVVVANRQSEGGRVPGGVNRYDVATGEEIPINFLLTTPSISLSPDGQLVAAAGLEASSQVSDLETGEVVATLETGDLARTVAFSPDGKLLALGHYGGSVVLLSTDNYEQVGRRMQSQTGRVTALQFSPDNRRLLTGSTDGTVQLWDVASQQAMGSPLEVAPDAHISAGFTPDGEGVIAVPHTGWGVRWDVREAAWREHACVVAGRDFSPEEWSQELPGRPYRPVCPQD